MAAMVDDLLDNAALSAGALRINRQPVRLTEMMTGSRSAGTPFFTAKGLSLQIQMARDLPEAAMIDQLRLSQACQTFWPTPCA